MTTGPTIKDIPLPTDMDTDFADVSPGSSPKTLDELERDHILTVLKKCNHKIGGRGGAAELLRLPATTLHSKIKFYRIALPARGEESELPHNIFAHPEHR